MTIRNNLATIEKIVCDDAIWFVALGLRKNSGRSYVRIQIICRIQRENVLIQHEMGMAPFLCTVITVSTCSLHPK